MITQIAKGVTFLAAFGVAGENGVLEFFVAASRIISRSTSGFKTGSHYIMLGVRLCTVDYSPSRINAVRLSRGKD